MKILLTGATGAIGKAVTASLVRHGHEVTGLVRNAAKGASLTAQGAQFAAGDVLDREQVAAIVGELRPDAIVHEATALASNVPLTRFDELFALTNRLRTEGTDNLLAAARQAAVPKMVIQSYCGWPFAKFGDPVAPETHPFDAALPWRQRDTSYALQYSEAAVMEAPLEGVALRYGGFYGPGTSLCANGSMIRDLRRRRLPIIGKGTGWWSFIHVADAAAATLAALQPGISGIFNIVDDEPAQVCEWLPYLARLAAAPAPLHVPRLVGTALAGSTVVSMMTAARAGSNAKARRELGWQPAHASWRQGFAESLAA
jgi:nucleoside-diphosphate-sugar epimerase